MKMKHSKIATGVATIWTALFTACSDGVQYKNFEEYPVRQGDLLEMVYTPASTSFTLWAPTAQKVRLHLYEEGLNGLPTSTLEMDAASDGCWTTKVDEDLQGRFYTFQVKYKGKWLSETPGINARAVGVNGLRGAIIDMKNTDPEGWENDVRPTLKSPADIVIYEMHHRDFSISPASGITRRGKFIALSEEGTTSPDGLATGIDHLKELGVTHVHLLPSYDYASVDETRLDNNQYNWGYDPVNYNVPDGSYSTDPYDPEVRIREFKQMVQSLHRAGIRVILDVVYNHVFDISSSPFERTVPGYFFRTREDGSWADASGCGNETASDREMMRRYMIESVRYWIEEYHIDGFRFDLMGIHDIETMNQIRAVASSIDSSIYIYGEGWAAQAPQLPAEEATMKANIAAVPGVAAFSDELRDALRGPFSDDHQAAFLAGLPGMEESIKFGIVGAVDHPGVDYSKVNYAKAPWAKEPTQMICYVSCHDDMCLVDRLKTSIPGISDDELIRLDLLAQTAVFTSQGVPFILAGEEVMRDKKGVHNSYNSPDSVNVIDWHRKFTYHNVFTYYRDLIALRRAHPAFRLGSADAVRKHLEFLDVPDSGVVAFRLKDHAGGDVWENIIVILNARKESVMVDVPNSNYTVVCMNGVIRPEGLLTLSGSHIAVPAQSALIVHD